MVCILQTFATHAQDRFIVTPSRFEIPERGLVDSLDIFENTNIFSIIPPTGWRLRFDPAQKQINFISTNQATSISIKFAETNAALVPIPELEALQAEVVARFPGGKVVSHFRSVTGMVPGEGFDVRWRASTGYLLQTRLSLVPYASGTIEISLTGSPESTEAERRVYTGLLNSLSRLAPTRR